MNSWKIDLIVYAALVAVFMVLPCIAMIQRRRLHAGLFLPVVMVSAGYWIPKLFVYLATR